MQFVPHRNRKVRIYWGATAIAIVLFVSRLGLFAQALPGVDYDRQVHPILAAKCFACHSQEKRSGGLSLATYEDVLNGGRSGAVVRPGNSSGSLIVQRINGSVKTRMPLGGPPLSPAEIGIITSWIDTGARLTPASAAAKPKWEAPLALERPAPPVSSWTGWTGPLDRFIAAYLAKHGVAEPRLV